MPVLKVFGNLYSNLTPSPGMVAAGRINNSGGRSRERQVVAKNGIATRRFRYQSSQYIVALLAGVEIDQTLETKGQYES